MPASGRMEEDGASTSPKPMPIGTMMNHSKSSGGDINIFLKLPVYSGVKNQHRRCLPPPQATHLHPYLSGSPPTPSPSVSF